jgi:UDP-glucuronate 4-epimerase
MKILVTGGAGFIGSNLIDKLLVQGHSVINIDNFDSFYARSIKEKNIENHFKFSNYLFSETDITSETDLSAIFSNHQFDSIIHLAAKAGVRPSIINPSSYEQTNVRGTINLLENAKKYGIKKFLFASSSSVYGINKNVPWSEDDLDLLPISPYAASKIAAEAYGKVYSNLYDIHFIALRFFTVFGPRQRPDLAIHKFFKLVHQELPIPFFGDGSTSRDYTFIDDITEGIINALHKTKNDESYEVFNLGNSNPVSLTELVNNIEQVICKKVILDKQPLQEGDVNRTYSKITKAEAAFSYKPKTELIDGLKLFNEWYKTQLK